MTSNHALSILANNFLVRSTNRYDVSLFTDMSYVLYIPSSILFMYTILIFRRDGAADLEVRDAI